jgi:hypothetical protein
MHIYNYDNTQNMIEHVYYTVHNFQKTSYSTKYSTEREFVM